MNGKVIMARIPLIVDIGMVVALATLSFWQGTQAAKVETVSRDIVELKMHVTSLQTSSIAADLAVTKVRDDNQDKQIQVLKTDLVARLVRIENKIDASR